MLVHGLCEIVLQRGWQVERGVLGFQAVPRIVHGAAGAGNINTAIVAAAAAAAASCGAG